MALCDEHSRLSILSRHPYCWELNAWFFLCIHTTMHMKPEINLSFIWNCPLWKFEFHSLQLYPFYNQIISCINCKCSFQAQWLHYSAFKCHEDVWEEEIQTHTFLSYALDGSRLLASCTRCPLDRKPSAATILTKFMYRITVFSKIHEQYQYTTSLPYFPSYNNFWWLTYTLSNNVE
jgi:hypothetical protein